MASPPGPAHLPGPGPARPAPTRPAATDTYLLPAAPSACHAPVGWRTYERREARQRRGRVAATPEGPQGDMARAQSKRLQLWSGLCGTRAAARGCQGRNPRRRRWRGEKAEDRAQVGRDGTLRVAGVGTLPVKWH